MTLSGAVGGAVARAVVFTLGAGERASFLLVSTNPVEGPGPWALKEVAQSDLCLSKGEAALGAGVPPPEASSLDTPTGLRVGGPSSVSPAAAGTPAQAVPDPLLRTRRRRIAAG